MEYVGVSNNLNRRMREHIRSEKLGGDNDIFAYTVADGRASHARINDRECEKIEQHNPP
ncbi:MAG: GIY-YIG nuclease family protein [Oscillospiraceae bacterium]